MTPLSRASDGTPRIYLVAAAYSKAQCEWSAQGPRNQRGNTLAPATGYCTLKWCLSKIKFHPYTLAQNPSTRADVPLVSLLALATNNPPKSSEAPEATCPENEIPIYPPYRFEGISSNKTHSDARRDTAPRNRRGLDTQSH